MPFHLNKLKSGPVRRTKPLCSHSCANAFLLIDGSGRRAEIAARKAERENEKGIAAQHCGSPFRPPRGANSFDVRVYSFRALKSRGKYLQIRTISSLYFVQYGKVQFFFLLPLRRKDLHPARACIYYRKNTRTGGKGHEKVHRDLRFLQGLAAEPRHLRQRARAYPLYFPACEVRALNVADGGEGPRTAFLASCGGERVLVSGVQDPYGEPIDAAYALLPDGTAVIEMAAAAGLPLVAGRKNPCVTTTYGVGQLIADALARGARRIVLGLGGSATNDGGCGCAAALGVRFTDAGGRAFVPVGATLDRIAHIDASAARERLHGVRVIAMCDITNPMHGHSGAACIFAPQKGADEAAVRELDRQLRTLDKTFRREAERLGRHAPRSRRGGRVRRRLRRSAGRGTAPRHRGRARRGGLRRPAHRRRPRHHRRGPHRRARAPTARSWAAWRAAPHARGVPVLPSSAMWATTPTEAYDAGVSAIFSINRLAVPRDEAKARSHIDYTHTLDDLLRCIRAAEQFKR